MNEMPVRIMQFDFEAERVKAEMPMLARIYGVSMTLPYLEPYLIRSMREALTLVTDDVVRQEVKQFIGQEAQHFRQHRFLNDIIREADPKLAGLQKIEDDMEADYQRYTNTKSLRFNLAYAEGFEAATFAAARHVLENNTLGDSDESAVVRMFRWHLTEEIEHRTATFNIYKHLFGGYFYRLVFGIFGQWHFFSYVRKFSKFIMENQPEVAEDAGGSTAMMAKEDVADSLKWKMFKTYMPWYDPEKVQLPDAMSRNSSKFSEEALEIRLPS